MTITRYQIQNVLRTYGQQLRSTLKNKKSSGLAVRPGLIAPEVKRKQVVERIALEVLKNLTVDGVLNETGHEALAKLSHEVGRQLAIIPDSEGKWGFQVVSGEEPEAPDEGRTDLPTLEVWKERLYQITYEIVDQNTILS